MKISLGWCGLILACGLPSAGAATLNLQLDPDRRLVPVGQAQEVVVKIDLDSERARRPNRLPLNIALVIDHSGIDGWSENRENKAGCDAVDRSIDAPG